MSEETWVGKNGEHYFLAAERGPAERVTQEQFVRAERAAGFQPKPGLGPVATGGFTAAGVRGTVKYETASASKVDQVDEGVSVLPDTVALYITVVGYKVAVRPAEPYDEAGSGYRLLDGTPPERRYRFHCAGCGRNSFPAPGTAIDKMANGHASECRRVPLPGVEWEPWDD